MIYTLFVLDFDGTYSIEKENDTGVSPDVYLVPEEKISEVQECAYNAGKSFGDDNNLFIDGICDYFEEFMSQRDIAFKFVGSINITFGERQKEYLANYIPHEIV